MIETRRWTSWTAPGA